MTTASPNRVTFCSMVVLAGWAVRYRPCVCGSGRCGCGGLVLRRGIVPDRLDLGPGHSQQVVAEVEDDRLIVLPDDFRTDLLAASQDDRLGDAGGDADGCDQTGGRTPNRRSVCLTMTILEKPPLALRERQAPSYTHSHDECGHYMGDACNREAHILGGTCSCLKSRPGGVSLRRALLLAVWVATSAVCLGDLSEYYGFGDMEILKLDWELGTPLAGDLNGDSLNDLVVCNNRKARIELLLQKPGFDPKAVEAAPEPVVGERQRPVRPRDEMAFQAVPVSPAREGDEPGPGGLQPRSAAGPGVLQRRGALHRVAEPWRGRPALASRGHPGLA